MKSIKLLFKTLHSKKSTIIIFGTRSISTINVPSKNYQIERWRKTSLNIITFYFVDYLQLLVWNSYEWYLFQRRDPNFKIKFKCELTFSLFRKKIYKIKKSQINQKVSKSILRIQFLISLSLLNVKMFFDHKTSVQVQRPNHTNHSPPDKKDRPMCGCGLQKFK